MTCHVCATRQARRFFGTADVPRACTMSCVELDYTCQAPLRLVFFASGFPAPHFCELRDASFHASPPRSNRSTPNRTGPACRPVQPVACRPACQAGRRAGCFSLPAQAAAGAGGRFDADLRRELVLCNMLRAMDHQPFPSHVTARRAHCQKHKNCNVA